MTIIWIRHGRKAYKNGRNPEGYPSHDSPLDEETIEEIKEKSRLLIAYGEPDLIITSPYKRTRDTTKFLLEEVKKDVKIIIDSEVSEFLGNQAPKGQKAEVYPETIIMNN